MANHIFLTGQKHIGKSTLLRKLLAKYPGTVDGILTVRTKDYLNTRFSVHLYQYQSEHIPTEENLLFLCGEDSKDIVNRFDHMACETLEKCKSCNLLLMDELGPHEAEASKFRKTIIELLNGNIPILGVLQAPAEEFWPEITQHPSVKLIELSKENRDNDELVEEILFHITQ